MHARTICVALLLSAALVPSCHGPGGTSYDGTYQLHGSASCTIDVVDFEATASCDDLKMKASFDEVEGELLVEKIEVVEKESKTTCFEVRECTYTYKGKGTLTEPDTPPDTEGLFQKLVGSWSGTIERTVACAREKLVSNAPSYCKKTDTSQKITYEFTASINPTSGDVTWTGKPAAGKGSFDVLETKGGVRAADRFYKRVAAADGG